MAGIPDVARALEEAERPGAKVLQPTPVSETRRIEMFDDPEGPRIGLIDGR